MLSPPPSTALLGPIGSSTEGPSATANTRPPHPVQRFVAPQDHRRTRCYRPHAFPAHGAALRGRIKSFPHASSRPIP
eukprot:387849-Pyramimonas_sp.AAC.1